MTKAETIPRRADTASAAFGESAELLGSFDATDFKTAQRLIALFARQPYTASGFPRVRPDDCRKVTQAIEDAFEANATLFKDAQAAKRFDAVVEAFAKTEVRSYPSEYQRVLILHARTKLLRNDAGGAQAIVGPMAARPYSMETDFKGMMEALAIDLQCKAALGDIEECARLALWRAVVLVRLQPSQAWAIGWRLANFIGLRGAANQRGLLGVIAQFWADGLSRSRRERGSAVSKSVAFVKARVCGTFLGSSLALLRFGDIPLGPRRKAAAARDEAPPSRKEIVVTRAMGGIGDLLMMTPGLRALSQTYGHPIKMVVPKRFFSVFANNPHVDVVDLDGPPIDLRNCRRWYNLTVCPASAYEAPNRPFAKKGRVELFASGMGVKRKTLEQWGQRIEINLTAEQLKFCEGFRQRHSFGSRGLVGIQPFSREEYRNYPGMNAVIAELARDFDVLIFHHTKDGISSGDRIFSTAGLTLQDSFALVSMLDVLVSVDSSFLHAASAFDIPVVALFGPIDGRVRTSHLRQVEVISLNDRFPCVPCWRNEDEMCEVTQQTGVSPCLSAIPTARVSASVRNFMAKASQSKENR